MSWTLFPGNRSLRTRLLTMGLRSRLLCSLLPVLLLVLAGLGCAVWRLMPEQAREDLGPGLALAFLLASAGAVLLTILLVLHATAPLLRLTRAVVRASETGAPEEFPVPPAGREGNAMGAAVNRMVAALRRQIEEIRATRPSTTRA